MLNGRQLRRFALSHQCTFSHHGATNAARDGGGDIGVAQVDIGVGDASFASCNHGGSSLFSGDGSVVFLLADGIGFNQRLVAAGSGRSLGQIGLGLCQGRLGALQAGAVWRAINLEEGLTGSDVGAFLEQTLLHDAGGTGTHLGNTRGFQAAGQVGDQRHVLQLYRHYSHFRGRGLGRSLRFLRIFFLVTAGGETQGGNQAQANGDGAGVLACRL